MSSRPTINDKIVAKAAYEILPQLEMAEDEQQSDRLVEQMVSEYSLAKDGYALARDLDLRHGWTITAQDVEILDYMHAIVEGKVRFEQKRWVEEENIQPKLKKGDVIDQGVIEGPCPYSPAKYRVKEHNSQREDCFLLVDFEVAEAQASASLSA